MALSGYDQDQGFVAEPKLFEVECIEAANAGLTKFKVKWVGYPVSESTWESASNLSDELIQAWKARQPATGTKEKAAAEHAEPNCDSATGAPCRTVQRVGRGYKKVHGERGELAVKVAARPGIGTGPPAANAQGSIPDKRCTAPPAIGASPDTAATAATADEQPNTFTLTEPRRLWDIRAYEPEFRRFRIEQIVAANRALELKLKMDGKDWSFELAVGTVLNFPERTDQNPNLNQPMVDLSDAFAATHPGRVQRTATPTHVPAESERIRSQHEISVCA